MASYNELNALIDAFINRNGVQAITGQILNGVLKAMVEQLGRGYTIMGAAIPTTDPGTPDGPECYFASETGTYTDFDGLQVAPGELALLCYTPSDGWTKATIYEGFQEVGATIDGNVGTPSVGVSYANGVLSFDFHNMKGNPGQNGQDGAAAGFGTIGADITGGVGTPAVSVESSGPATAKNLQFHFTNLKGETGVTSVVATVDNTTGTPACTVSLVGQQLTLAFTGLKGAQGNTGSSVDYPFTIVNNLTTDDATQALSAAQGVVLDGKVTQLEAKVNGLDETISGWNNGKYIATNQGVGQTCPKTLEAGDAWKCVVVNIKPGAEYIVNGLGAGTARLWCFLDATDKILSVAGPTDSSSDNSLVLTPPDNATQLIINTKNGGDSYEVIHGLDEKVESCLTELTELTGLSEKVDDLWESCDIPEEVDFSNYTKQVNWITSAGEPSAISGSLHYTIPIDAFKIKVAASSNEDGSAIVFASEVEENNWTPVPGTSRTGVASGTTEIIDVPSGTKYLIVACRASSQEAMEYRTPESLEIYKYIGKEVDKIGKIGNEVDGFAQDITKSGAWVRVNAAVKIGDTVRFRISASASTWSRVIVGNVSNRIYDGNATPGAWYEVVSEYEYEYLEVYIIFTSETKNARFESLVNLSLSDSFLYERTSLLDGAVTTPKIADGAVTKEKMSPDVFNGINDKLLSTTRTVNLFNELDIVRGHYINYNGDIEDAASWAISPYIPVTAGNKYTITAETVGRSEGVAWFDANKDKISGGSISIYTTHEAPTGAAYLVFNVAASNVFSTKIMVVEGEESLPYVPYNQVSTDAISGLDDAIDSAIGRITGSGKLSVTKNGNNISVSDGSNSIAGVLTNNVANSYAGNPVFDFNSWTYNGQTRQQGDDIAPLHAYGTTIGANHGQPCVRATIENHGLDNTAIGTGWTKDGYTFYVMRIVDTNNVLFLSQNLGTATEPSFVNLTTGTLSRNGETLTVSAVATTQLYPALKNHTIQLVLDGKQRITDNGTYACNFFEIVETYDIMNPASTLDKIIARAGQSGDPVFDGDPGIHIENVYRFTSSMAIVVIANVVPVQQFSFSDAMFSQAVRIGENGVVKYYVPNSLPLATGGAYDMRKPLAMTWNDQTLGISIRAEQMADPTNHPVNRVLQYDSGIGFALGFLTDRGVGQSLLDFTNYTFELRNNTGKVYPHGVDNKVGSTLSPGQIYTAVMYRALFVPETSGNRMSMYHFDLDGTEYVYIDYSGTMLDKVVVDDSLNGRKVEILEAVNTELKSNVYNGGFYVNATYVEGETCYLIAKIS